MNTSTVGEIAVVISKEGRRCLWAKDVGAVIGMNEFYLDAHFRPEAWAMPRDFSWSGVAYLYAEESLPQLADSLTAGGARDSAIVLREWIAARLAKVKAEEATFKVAASDVVLKGTASAKSRLQEWEDEHQ